MDGARWPISHRLPLEANPWQRRDEAGTVGRTMRPESIPYHDTHTRCEYCSIPTVQAVTAERHWPRRLTAGYMYPPLYAAPDNQAIHTWGVHQSVILFYYEDVENNLFVWDPFCQRWRLVLFEGVMYPAVDGLWYQTTLLRVPRDDNNKETYANTSSSPCCWTASLAMPKRKSNNIPVLVITTPEGKSGYLVPPEYPKEKEVERSRLSEFGRKIRESFKKV